MSEADIRTKLAAILAGVSNIGMVYDYKRNAASDAAFIALFSVEIGGQPQIRGWQIYRKSASEEQKTTAAPNEYAIDGFMGLQDAAATAKTFTALVEAVRAAIRADVTLHNAGYGHGLAQVMTEEELLFGAVLCHHARLELTVHDYITS